MTTVHNEAGQRLELEQCAVSKREIISRPKVCFSLFLRTDGQTTWVYLCVRANSMNNEANSIASSLVAQFNLSRENACQVWRWIDGLPYIHNMVFDISLWIKEKWDEPSVCTHLTLVICLPLLPLFLFSCTPPPIQHQLTEMWRQGLITASSTGHTTKTRAKDDEQKITVIYTYSYRPFWIFQWGSGCNLSNF